MCGVEQMAARQSHSLEVVGSSPTAATMAPNSCGDHCEGSNHQIADQGQLCKERRHEDPYAPGDERER